MGLLQWPSLKMTLFWNVKNCGQLKIRIVRFACAQKDGSRQVRGPNGICDPGAHKVLYFLDSFIDIRTFFFFFYHLRWNSYSGGNLIQSFPDYSWLWSCDTSMTLSCNQESHTESTKMCGQSVPTLNVPRLLGLESSCLSWLVSSLLSGGPFLLLFLCLPDTSSSSPSICSRGENQIAKHFRTGSQIRMDWSKGKSLGLALEDVTSKTVMLTILDASKAFQISSRYQFSVEDEKKGSCGKFFTKMMTVKSALAWPWQTFPNLIIFTYWANIMGEWYSVLADTAEGESRGGPRLMPSPHAQFLWGWILQPRQTIIQTTASL